MVLAALLVVGVVRGEILMSDGGRSATAPGSVDLPQPVWLTPMLVQVRGAPARHLTEPRSRSIVEGVVFGRTDDVDEVDAEAFRRSGLSHLLAASGQNIALVAALCVILGIATGGARLTGVLLGLVAIPAYVLLVGGGASIVRAGIMGELALIAWIAGRLSDVRHGIVVAAAAIFWIWPGSHRGLGLQLSFVCVCALAIWASPLTRWLTHRGVPTVLAASIAASTICTLATAPILYLRTGSTPLLGAVANLPAVPLASVLLVVGLPASLLDSVSPAAAHPALVLCGAIARVLLWLAHAAAGSPMASTSSIALSIGAPAVAAVVGSSIGRAGVGRFHAWVLRCSPVALACIAIASAAGAGLATASTSRDSPASPGSVEITILDVGQGQATLVRDGPRSVLIDAGPVGAGVGTSLRRRGVSQLDHIVLSHHAADHIGGLVDIVDVPVGSMLVPAGGPGDWSTLPGRPRVTASCRGDVVRLARATISVVSPRCDGVSGGDGADVANDRSLAVIVEVGAARVGIPGDAESAAAGDLGQLDVLVVAHHGSADVGLAGMLARSRPGLAVISVGRDNGYGHPAPATEAALAEAGVPVVRTDVAGDIELRVHEAGGGIAVRREIDGRVRCRPLLRWIAAIGCPA